MIQKMSNFITKKEFLIFYFVLVPIVIFLCGLGKTRTPHDIYVFSLSKQSPEIYLGSFYNHSKSNKLRFGDGTYEQFNGAITVKRQKDQLHPSVSYQIDKTKLFQMFFLHPDDQVCFNETCRTITANTTLSVVSDGETVSLSSKVAKIVAPDVPNFEPFYIHSVLATDVVLADASTGEARQLSLFNNKRIGVDFYKDTSDYLFSNQIMLLFSSIISTLFIYGLIFIILNKYNKLNIFDVFILILVALEYFILFPGIFSTDMVFFDIPAGVFSIHYSSIYAIYNYIVYMFNLKLIQLPIVIWTALTFIIVAHSINHKIIRNIFYSLIIFVILFCPIYYAMTFVSQRYFITPIIMILSLYFFLKSIFFEEGNRKNVIISVFLLTFVVLLRKEYIIIPICYLVVLLFYRKWIIFKTKLLYLFGALFLVFGVVLVNHIVPALFHVNVAYNELRLETVSLMDMVRPYVPCPGSPAERKPTKSSGLLVEAIDLAGSTKAYCDSPTSEAYFWGPANNAWIEGSDQRREVKKLKKGFVRSFFEQPLPSLVRFKDRAIAILNNNVWHLSDKYKDRDLENVWFYKGTADSYNLVLNRPTLRPMEQFVVKMANMLNADINYWSWLSAFILLFVYPVLFYRLRVVSILNCSIIILGCGSIFLSPTVNWAYILMVPVWVFFAIPFALMEKDWLKSLKEKRESIVA